MLGAAAGHANAAIARRLGVTCDTARKWRGRFAGDALDGLRDRKRAGRPPRFTPVQQAQVKALACELPAASGVPLSRWSAAVVAHEVVTAGLVDTISGATVRRWLRTDALKPWQYRSWAAPRAADFAARAAVVLDLYAGSYDDQPLGDGDFVLCADEKTSIQARCRCHPTLPPGKARMMRVEHEYQPRHPWTSRVWPPAGGPAGGLPRPIPTTPAALTAAARIDMAGQGHTGKPVSTDVSAWRGALLPIDQPGRADDENTLELSTSAAGGA